MARAKGDYITDYELAREKFTRFPPETISRPTRFIKHRGDSVVIVVARVNTVGQHIFDGKKKKKKKHRIRNRCGIVGDVTSARVLESRFRKRFLQVRFRVSLTLEIKRRLWLIDERLIARSANCCPLLINFLSLDRPLLLLSINFDGSFNLRREERRGGIIFYSSREREVTKKSAFYLSSRVRRSTFARSFGSIRDPTPGSSLFSLSLSLSRRAIAVAPKSRQFTHREQESGEKLAEEREKGGRKGESKGGGGHAMGEKREGGRESDYLHEGEERDAWRKRERMGERLEPSWLLEKGLDIAFTNRT